MVMQWAFIALLLSPGSTPQGQPNPLTSENLYGRWNPYIAIAKGKLVTGDGDNVKRPLILSKDTAEWHSIALVIEKAGKGTLKLDVNKKPPTLEIKTDDTVYRGVLLLEEKTLSIHFNTPGEDFPKPLPLNRDGSWNTNEVREGRAPGVVVICKRIAEPASNPDGEKAAIAALLKQRYFLFGTDGRELRSVPRRGVGISSVIVWRIELNDAGVDNLLKLKGTQNVTLNSARAAKGALRRLKDMKDLRSLRLNQHDEIPSDRLKEINELDQIDTLVLNAITATDEVLGEFKDLKNLKSLSLAQHSVSSAGYRALAALPELRELNICDGEFEFGAVSELDRLESLSLDSLKVPDTSWSDIGRLKAVRALSFRFVDIGDPGFKAISSLGEIQTLSFVGVNGFGSHINELRGLKKLKSLSVRDDEWTGKGLGDLKSLQVVKLEGQGFNDEGLKELRACKELAEIQLKCANLTEASLEALEGHRKLVTLALGRGKLSCETLPRFRNVTKLTLVGDLKNYTDETMKAVAQMPALHDLTLAHTKVTDAGLRELHQCTKLKTIMLQSNETTKAGEAELKKALPKLKIVKP